jgi:ADP-L-glycero-D-manno-heptose 6-epimerase
MARGGRSADRSPCAIFVVMIVVTGAAGFIGSCLVAELLRQGYADVVAVDDFHRPDKVGNLAEKNLRERVPREQFAQWLHTHQTQVQFIFHLGARTDTTGSDTAIFDELNVRYSQMIWDLCVRYQLPLIYASSAATYGGGEHGYLDDHAIIPRLRPLNPYGQSKQTFDEWVLQRTQSPFFWAGFKFFNVYGPNEYHKGRMASVVYHSFGQVRASGGIRLFRSHRPDYADGAQLRDFVYVKDVCKVCIHFMEQRTHSGIYNLGSGQARTFLALAGATFSALGAPERITFVDTPMDIRDKYQYYTQAAMEKMRGAGYTAPFHTLEEGVGDYVRNYLAPKNYY